MWLVVKTWSLLRFQVIFHYFKDFLSKRNYEHVHEIHSTKSSKTFDKCLLCKSLKQSNFNNFPRFCLQCNNVIAFAQVCVIHALRKRKIRQDNTLRLTNYPLPGFEIHTIKINCSLQLLPFWNGCTSTCIFYGLLRQFYVVVLWESRTLDQERAKRLRDIRNIWRLGKKGKFWALAAILDLFNRS